MTKLSQTLLLVIVGLVVVVAATPAITRLIHAAVPLIVAVGVVAALLRAVWFYTR